LIEVASTKSETGQRHRITEWEETFGDEVGTPDRDSLSLNDLIDHTDKSKAVNSG
jgi:hypothetical protein